MEPEILFRGKRLDNWEWAYGYYIGPISPLDTHDIFDIKDRSDVSYEVNPHTIGQYTGLTDKNGVKIFVGDILRHNRGTFHKVVFEQRNGSAFFGWAESGDETWHFDTLFFAAVGGRRQHPRQSGALGRCWMRLYDNDAYREEFMELVYDLLRDDGANDRANQIIAAFDSAPEVEAEPLPPNDPPTLEELREMDGAPVWVVQIDGELRPFWMLVDAEDESAANRLYCAMFEDYGTEWLAYRRKPEEV